MQGPFVGAKDGKYRYGYDVRDAICAPVGGGVAFYKNFFLFILILRVWSRGFLSCAKNSNASFTCGVQGGSLANKRSVSERLSNIILMFLPKKN